MTGDLTAFYAFGDDNSLDRVILMLILCGIAAAICFLISLVAIGSSNWKVASAFAVLTDMFGLIWTSIHPVLLLFMFAYTALVLVGAYVKGSKNDQQQSDPQENENQQQSELQNAENQQPSDPQNKWENEKKDDDWDFL